MGDSDALGKYSSQVRLIALQLESGERLQHSFSPGTTLWEILMHWENIPDR